MKKNIILLIAPFVFNSLFGGNLLDYENIVRDYTTTLTLLNETKSYNELDRLNDIFDERTNQNHHNDLNLDSENLNYGQYFLKIKISNNNSFVFNESIDLYECDKVVYARIIKTKKPSNTTYNQIIEIAKSTKKILSIYEIGTFKDNCLNESLKDLNKEKFANEFLIKANTYFNEKDYVNAKNYYEKVLDIDKYKYNIQKQIAVCTKQIDFTYIITKANSLFSLKKFYAAKAMFEKAINIDMSKRNEVYSEIEKCNKAININIFQSTVKAADKNFNDKNFINALKLYSNALNYSSNNKYVKSQIEICKMKDLSYVKSYIKQTIREIENNPNKENKLKTFKLFRKYENTGLLNGENYYFMSVILIENSKNLSRDLGLSKNTKKSLISYYMYKSMKLGYKDAKLQWERLFNNSGRKIKNR